MNILLVHGMGRTPLSWWPILLRLRAAGLTTNSFAYSTAFQDFQAIQSRLVQRIIDLSERGEYVLMGHSLGGVLIRGAVLALPSGVRQPSQVFLIGSPMRPARMAMKLRRRWLFRVLTGDCGEFLASKERMENIGSLSIPTTSIIGIKGLKGRFSPFGYDDNDGVVAASEACAEWVDDELRVPVVHTLLPASLDVASIVLTRLQSKG